MAILVVDDEVRLRQTIARSLAAHGHAVDQVGTHREAVEAASRGDYDLMLLDVNLPDATGWDVLRDLRAIGRDVPAVVVSAVPPSAKRVKEFNPFGVLHKPFPMDALLRMVRQAGNGAGELDRLPERSFMPDADPGGTAMLDLFMFLFSVGFFAASIAYVHGCEAL
jgi:DNA-binding response OmpR family regulator